MNGSKYVTAPDHTLSTSGIMPRRTCRRLWGLMSIWCLLQCTTEGGGNARLAGDDVLADTEQAHNTALTSAARLHAAAIRGRRVKAPLGADAQRKGESQRMDLRSDSSPAEHSRSVLTKAQETDQLLRWSLNHAEEPNGASGGNPASRGFGEDAFLTDSMTRRASQQGLTTLHVLRPCCPCQ